MANFDILGNINCNLLCDGWKGFGEDFIVVEDMCVYLKGKLFNKNFKGFSIRKYYSENDWKLCVYFPEDYVTVKIINICTGNKERKLWAGFAVCEE